MSLHYVIAVACALRYECFVVNDCKISSVIIRQINTRKIYSSELLFSYVWFYKLLKSGNNEKLEILINFNINSLLKVNICWNKMKNAVYTHTNKKKISQRKMFALFYIIQFATATVKRNIKMRTYENVESVGTHL